MAAAPTETPIWGDELKDYMNLEPGSARWVEVTNLLSWEFDGDQETYEPDYINRRTSPTFTLAEKVGISYEKDMYRNNELDAFLAKHEDDTDVPVEICRVRTWEGAAPMHGAKMAPFFLTPSQLDKNTKGEPVKLKGTLSMNADAWTQGTFDTAALAFSAGDADVPEGSTTPEEPTVPEEPTKALDDMTIDELKAYAAAHDIDITGKTLRNDILEAIKVAEAEMTDGE